MFGSGCDEQLFICSCCGLSDSVDKEKTHFKNLTKMTQFGLMYRQFKFGHLPASGRRKNYCTYMVEP